MPTQLYFISFNFLKRKKKKKSGFPTAEREEKGGKYPKRGEILHFMDHFYQVFLSQRVKHHCFCPSLIKNDPSSPLNPRPPPKYKTNKIMHSLLCPQHGLSSSEEEACVLNRQPLPWGKRGLSLDAPVCWAELRQRLALFPSAPRTTEKFLVSLGLFGEEEPVKASALVL